MLLWESFLVMAWMVSANASAIPRLLHAFDTRRARRRFSTASASSRDSPGTRAETKGAVRAQKHRKEAHPLDQLSEMCVALARSLRIGQPSGVALQQVLSTHLSSEQSWVCVVRALNEHESVAIALNRGASEACGDHQLTMSLLLSAVVDNEFVPGAVDKCSTILQGIRAHKLESQVASAQAQLSTRILTALPLVVGGFTVLASGNGSLVLHSHLCLIAIACGVSLNLVGRRISRILVMRTLNSPSSFDDFAHVSDHISLALRSGSDLALAFRRAAATSPRCVETCTTCASLIQMGEPLHASLQPLVTQFGSAAIGLVDSICSAYADGAPVAATVERISQDAREQRRRANEVRIRQLPTRLTLPVVLCVLPSFLLLTVAPLMASALHGAHISIASQNSATSIREGVGP
jgi:tight adherence protein B